MGSMTITVENSIHDLLPEVVIDFLREIIVGDGTILTFMFVPVKLGFGDIQEIRCENENGIVIRRVFGFFPVSAKLRVSHDANEVIMQLAA